eukprot:2284465-Rhodomonas_salina.1
MSQFEQDLCSIFSKRRRHHKSAIARLGTCVDSADLFLGGAVTDSTKIPQVRRLVRDMLFQQTPRFITASYGGSGQLAPNVLASGLETRGDWRSSS